MGKNCVSLTRGCHNAAMMEVQHSPGGKRRRRSDLLSAVSDAAISAGKRQCLWAYRPDENVSLKRNAVVER